MLIHEKILNMLLIDTKIGIGYKHKGTLHFHDNVTFDIRIVRKGDRVDEFLDCYEPGYCSDYEAIK